MHGAFFIFDIPKPDAMLKLAILVIFYFTFPLVIIYMCKKWSILKKVGSIVLAYGFGMLFGSTGILPQGSDAYKMAIGQGKAAIPMAEMNELVGMGQAFQSDILVNQIATLQDLIFSLVIPLAFPLLLFSITLKKWFRYAKKGLISVILALVAGLVMVTAGFFVFKDQIPESWRLAGMFVGIYTGGQPNFVALSMALDVDPSLYLVASTYDIVVGAFLVLFYITIAPKLFRFILPPFKEVEDNTGMQEITSELEDTEDYSGMFVKGRIGPLLKALGLSVLIFAAGAGLSFLLTSLPQMVVVILVITTLGLLASLVKSINRIEKTFQLGMYLILVFSLTVASMANINTLLGKGMVNLILFISWCYWGSLILHLILARIFRIDSDNFLITSAAFIFSPPFVPLVANALKNKTLIVTGITGGLLGYLLGNYFGVALAYFLKGF